MKFAWRLRRYKSKIKYVCIDMSNAYSSWVEAVLPKAQIVYDHFHVIKATIEKKESLRRIYRFSESRYDAKMELLEWCSSARASAIPEMIQMAKAVERHLSGILGYWDFDHASSGSAEGFNTKIRLLIKQSHGIRDFKYLRLKIHDLPSRRIKTHI